MFEDSAKVGKPPNSTESVAGQNDGFGAKPEAVHLEQELPLSAETGRSLGSRKCPPKSAALKGRKDRRDSTYDRVAARRPLKVCR